jgi:hypothetical protein
MLFRYLASGKSDRLMLSDFMRLTSAQARVSDDYSLRVRSDDDDLGLYSSDRSAYSDNGVGACLKIEG